MFVDNGSTDDTIAEALAAVPDLRLIAGHGNVGFGPGVNLGVSASRGDLVLVLNPDAPLIDGSLSQLCASVPAGTPSGLLACAVMARGVRSHLVFRERGWARELVTFLVWAFLKPREFRYERPLAAPTDPTSWISGAAFLVARTEFEQVGGFDNRYFLYYEDTDLSRRYRAHGFPLRTTDAICVAHSSAGAKSSPPAMRVAWTLLSMVEYVARWGGSWRGRVAAACIAWFLRILAAVEPLLPSLPMIGERATKSARRAAAVFSYLAEVCDGSLGPAEAYPLARNAFGRRVNGQGRHRSRREVGRHGY